eukprot:Tbor_TRINITY_DN4790_c0_g1::TRINITY_DN4790_c0_g1_i1::g.17059::m.17059
MSDIVSLEDFLEKDKNLLNSAILDEEIELRERIVQIKTITYKKRKKLEEKRRLKANKRTNKQIEQSRISDIFKISNRMVDGDHGPDDEVTEKEFDERCSLLRHKSDSVDLEIKSSQEICDKLTDSFRTGCKILFQLSRLEIVCTKMDLWVEGLKETTNVDTSPVFQEELIAERIRALLSKRDEELNRIMVLKNKIVAASESLKLALAKQNGDVTENGDNDSKICTTENGDNDGDSNNLITNAIKAASDKLMLLRQKNNDLLSKIKATKASNKRNADKYRIEREREERGMHVNNRAINELNKGNAFITTNIESLMQQLNLEHYGLGGGPSTLQATKQKQLAISERRTALIEQRAKSKEANVSQSRDDGNAVKEISYSPSDRVSPHNPENSNSPQ